MSQYTEAEFVQSFSYREVRVDIYTCRKGAMCCDMQQEVEDRFCACCGTPLIHEPVFQICIAGVFIPSDYRDEEAAVELAKYLLDEHPDGIFSPKDYLLMHLDVEESDDGGWGDGADGEEGWGVDESDPAPGSPGDRFNRLLGGDPPAKDRSGRSDLLDPDPVLPDDIITEQIVEAGLATRSMDIVPSEPDGQDNRSSPHDAATLASLAKQAKCLGWGAMALEIVKRGREKR